MNDINKYLISVDIEGITGVISKEFAGSNGKYYSLARKYMANDVNAVVKGIIKADPQSWIAVRDAHGGRATNLDLEALHPRAAVIQGWGNEMNMLATLDETYAGVFLVGYHAGGNNNKAVLAHTYSSMVHYVKANGEIINEAGIVSLYAGHFKVPVVFLSGDDQVISETKPKMPHIVGVAVKESLARDCAMSVSLAHAQNLLETGAYEATQLLQQPENCPISVANLPMRIEVSLYNTGYFISTYAKIKNILSFDAAYAFDDAACSISYDAATQLEAFQRLNLLANLLYGVQ